MRIRRTRVSLIVRISTPLISSSPASSAQDYLRASLFILSPSLPKPKKKPRSECAASPSDFVTVMRALGVCVRAAVDSGKRGVLAQLSFSLLSRILLSASRLPSARMLVVAIAR